MNNTEIKQYAKQISQNDPSHDYDEMVSLLSQHDEQFAKNVLAVSQGVAEREVEELSYEMA